MDSNNLEEDASLDLFGSLTEEELELQSERANRLSEERLSLAARLSKSGKHLASQSRQLYLLRHTKRSQIQIFHSLLKTTERDTIVSATRTTVSIAGWTTSRHKAYPTTDIPLSDINTLHEPVEMWLKERLLHPLARHHGFDPTHLFFKDLFLVLYDASPGHQRSLQLHTDGCLISFNILLNKSSDFEGGGTYFAHQDRTYALQQGDALVHDSKLVHSGQQVVKGQRFLLVGFVDTVNEHAIRDKDSRICRAMLRSPTEGN